MAGVLGVILFGVDGTAWNLRSGPVVLTTGGIGGFGHATPKYSQQETARAHGARTTSWKFGVEKNSIPLKWNNGFETDIDTQATFWDSIFSEDVNQQCTVRVTRADGSYRDRKVRLVDDGGMAYTLDPYVWQKPFSVTFQADDPWWYGPEVPVPLQVGATSQVNFFGGGDPAAVGSGAPFVISPGRGSDATTVTNPGKAPAYPDWWIQGVGDGATYFRLGVNGHFVSGNFNIGPNDKLQIRTDPILQVALLNGVNVTRQLREVDFAPLPSGAAVPISVDITGQAVVTSVVRPRYARAF